MGNTNRRRPLSTTSILVLPLRAVAAAAAAAAAASLEIAATITTISVPKMRPHLAANRRVHNCGGFGSGQLALTIHCVAGRREPLVQRGDRRLRLAAAGSRVAAAEGELQVILRHGEEKRARFVVTNP